MRVMYLHLIPSLSSGSEYLRRTFSRAPSPHIFFEGPRRTFSRAPKTHIFSSARAAHFHVRPCHTFSHSPPQHNFTYTHEVTPPHRTRPRCISPCAPAPLKKKKKKKKKKEGIKSKICNTHTNMPKRSRIELKFDEPVRGTIIENSGQS